MAENQQQTYKKKTRLLWRIFKWIGLSLLTLLLITLLVFRAPWKIITLLVIILAACTILPKPYRKWFWLSVGAVVIALIFWIFLPDDNEGWRPYTFDEELAALNAKYAISDNENAAKFYYELLKDYDKDEFYSNLSNDEAWKFPSQEPWLSKDHPKIAEWLKQHRTTIATLIKASGFEKYRFPVTLDTGPNNKWMTRLSATRRWAFLLVTAADNDLAEGRLDEAMEKYRTTLQIGKHLCQQPQKLDILVGIAIECLAINRFNGFIIRSDATAEHLKIIEESLAGIKHDWNSDLPKIIDSEKILSKKSLGCFYEINPKGRIRLNRDPMAEWLTSWKRAWEKSKIEDQQIKEKLVPKPYEYLTYWQKKTIKLQTLLRWFFLPSNPQKAGEIIDAIYEQYYVMAAPDYDWQEKETEAPELVLPSVSKWPRINQRRTIEHLVDIPEETFQIYGFHKYHDQYLRYMSSRKGCKIVLALRRYKNINGHWPQNLNEIKPMITEYLLIDPINNGSFVYKRTDKDFILYSRGKNNIDENGNRTNADDWPIWLAYGIKGKNTRKDTNDK